MVLEKIDSPRDVKNLSYAELDSLCREIRQLIMEVVFQNGGHLASSLGAVELCTALHYCLNAPADDIVFDVGHQCYAHKIITGRRERFSRLRTYKGISGFPDCNESPYDLFISGHASTAVSWAVGVAEAKRLSKDTSKTVAVIGDGSLTGGMCFEGLNICGHNRSDVLIILNHNEMSISRSVGALSNYLTKLLSLPIYNKIRNELEQFVSHLPKLGKVLAKSAKRFEEALKSLIVPGLFFEELGFRYFGPIDGHNLEQLIPTLKNVTSLSGPRILHVLTKKGKGYAPAEANPEKFHSASPLCRKKTEDGKSQSAFSEIFAQRLTELARHNDKLVAFTAAMPEGTGLDIFRNEHPRRFFDVGIAESTAVGMAAGFAKKGFIPVVAVYSSFLQRAYDQIVHDVALQNLPMIFAVDRAGFVGEDGPTHHGVLDISYLNCVPRMICMAPKDKEELEDMLDFAVQQKAPVSIRYPKGRGFSLGKRAPLEIGKAQVMENGKDIAIIALGSMVSEAVQAAALFKKEGIQPVLVNARFIKPLDEKLLRSLAEECKIIVTVEEGVLQGGFGSSVLAFYEQADLLDRTRVMRLGIADEFSTYASRHTLLRLSGLDSVSLHRKIMAFARKEMLWHK